MSIEENEKNEPVKPAETRTPLGNKPGAKRPAKPVAVVPLAAEEAKTWTGPQVAAFTSQKGGVIRLFASGDLTFENMEPVTDPAMLDFLKTYMPRLLLLSKLQGAVNAGLQFDLLGKLRFITATDQNSLNEAGQIRNAITEANGQFLSVIASQEPKQG